MLLTYCLINEIPDQHAPIRKVKVRTHPNPFVTEEIRGLIKTGDRWRKLVWKTGDPAAWSAYRNCKRDVKLNEGYVWSKDLLSNRKLGKTPRTLATCGK
jgi:hypothetical protein